MSLIKRVVPSLLIGTFLIILIYHTRDSSSKNKIGVRTIIRKKKGMLGSKNSVQISDRSASIQEGPAINTVRGSKFRDVLCKEDLQHIQEIETTNVENTSTKQLTDIFFKSVTRYAITSCVLSRDGNTLAKIFSTMMLGLGKRIQIVF